METPVPAQFQEMIAAGLAEMQVQRRIVQAAAAHAAKAAGLDGKPWSLSADGTKLITED